MQAFNLKTQLDKLIELQEVDSQIYALRHKREAKPKEIAALQAAFDEKKQRLAECEKELLDAQKKRKDRELELASKEESTKKLQGQLYQLKTNKEYQAMLQQIEDSKADASLIEDQILELFNQADKIKNDTAQEKEKVAQEEKSFNEARKKVEDSVKEIDEHLAQLEAQRKRIAPDIDAKILSQYDRILASRDGLAIVKAKGNSCKGCNMFVPPQVINLIKMYENIVTCEMCNRMLYVDQAD